MPGCTTRASFSLAREPRSRCHQHRTPEMISKHRKCDEEGCTKQALWCGNKDQTPTKCKSHKSPDMVQPRACKQSGCRSLATFGTPGSPPVNCNLHRKRRMVDKYSRYCIGCGLSMGRPRCASCNPISPTSRKRRERVFADALIKEFPDHHFILDNSSSDIRSCSGKALRPDILIHGLDRSIIIEYDEHAHKKYDVECEVIRMIHLVMSQEGTFTFILRYNPDAEGGDANIPLEQRQQQFFAEFRLSGMRPSEFA